MVGWSGGWRVADIQEDSGITSVCGLLSGDWEGGG